MNDKKNKKNLIVICGPTASGKTSIGVRLAEKLDGEIISADSRQVYRDMDIGTGKDIEEYNRPGGKVPFHMIDIAQPYEIYTLYHYQRDCCEVINNLFSKKRLPVMVGGSGLYIEAVLKKYQIANVPENHDFRESLNRLSKENLESILKNKNLPLYKKTDTSSKKRIIRALEITKSGYEAERKQEFPDINPLVICINTEKEQLVSNIDSRLKKRLEQGMIDEVRNLIKKGVKKERIELFGMEYKHILGYITGRVEYNEMYNNLKRDIIRLSKRQKTYFRGMERRGTSIFWIGKPEFDSVFEIVSKFDFN